MGTQITIDIAQLDNLLTVTLGRVIEGQWAMPPTVEDRDRLITREKKRFWNYALWGNPEAGY